MWQSLSHAPRYSWVSPWIPQARTGAWKLRTHTHPRLYWFLGFPEIAIAVLVRTRTWDVMKPQQSPTGCTTPAGGNSNTHLITLSLNSNTLRELNIMTIKLSNKKKRIYSHIFGNQTRNYSPLICYVCKQNIIVTYVYKLTTVYTHFFFWERVKRA